MSMKMESILYVLAVVCMVCMPSVVATKKGQIRGSSLKDGNWTTTIHCRVTLVHTTFVSDEKNSMTDDHQTSCIPIIDWTETDDLFPITLPTSVHSKHQKSINDGSLLLTISNAILGTNGIETSKQSKYDVVENAPQHYRELQSANLNFKSRMTVAVVRISTTDASPKDSAASIRNTYFGDGINFQSQYDACSFGKITWEMAPVGVVDVKLDRSVASYGTAAAIVTEAQNKLKSNRRIAGADVLADKVIFCLPPGTGSWAGSAGVKHWRVQLNNDWCRSLTGTMHELAHTIGLLHSHADGIAYNDRTGYMGSGYTDTDGPLKCFNGYNNYQLGWYKSKQLDMDIKDGGKLVNLATFVDFKKASSNEPVLINIDDTYFLQYNRKKGFNSGTEQAANQVTVTRPVDNGTDRVAELSSGTRAQVSNYKGLGNLIIQACSTKTGNNGADIMVVSIAIGKSLCGTNNSSNGVSASGTKKKTTTTTTKTKPKTKTPVKSSKSFLSWLSSVLGK